MKRQRKNDCAYILKNSGFILILIVLFQSLTVTNLVSATEPASTVDTVPMSAVVSKGFQRKAFYAENLFWQFYSNGTDAGWEFSSDGTTWDGAFTSIGPLSGWHVAEFLQGYSIYFSVWFDGTYLHYARTNNSDLFYRRGDPEPDGSITWCAAEQMVHDGTPGARPFYERPCITVDTNGYAWIGALNYVVGGFDEFPYVLKNANNDGTWTTDFAYELSDYRDDTNWNVAPVPLTDGKVYVIYLGSYMGAKPLGKLYDGGWGAEENDLVDFFSSGPSEFSVVAIGDNVHLVYLRDVTYEIRHNERVWGVGWYEDDVPVQKNFPSYGVTPALSADPSENTLYCFWTNSTGSQTIDDHVWYKKWDGGWGTAIDWINESEDNIEYDYHISSFYQDYGCYIGVAYITKTSPLFKVRFGYLGPLPPPTWEANVTLADLNFTIDQQLDEFDWGSSWGDSAFWYTDYPWVFEGKRRYSFQIDYTNETLSTVEQFGIRFTDEMDQTHTIWYDKDANTLTVTSPFDGISGWIHYFNQGETKVTAVFQIMFNKPIPDSYGVQLEIRAIAGADSGWLTPSGGLFNIYNLGGISTLYSSGTAGRIPGGDIFEIYAADTRTRNIIPIQDFDVRYVPLQEGWQELGIQIIQAGDEQALLEELTGWKSWMTSRTEARTIYPTNRLPDTASSGDTTYHSYPFGLLIKSDSTLNQSLIMEKEFFRKIYDTDNETVTAEFWATVSNDTQIIGQVLITDDGYVDDLLSGTITDTKRIVEFKFNGDGRIRLTDGTPAYIYPANYSGMVWANYTFVMNLTAQTYDFYVDEVLKAEAVDFREAATSVSHISFLDTLNPVFPAQPVEFYVDDVLVHTDFDEAYGGVSEATMLFDKNQHWSMDFDFFVEQGQRYAQGISGSPERIDDDYSDYGYLEFGWDIMINKTMVHDFLVARVNISDGYISGKNNWVEFNVSWYEQGVNVKNDILYGLFEGYSIWPGGEKDTSGFHWDIWFNRANASTVVGARINTEYYGMSDKSVWWAIWSSKWTPMRSEVSESTLFIDLRDNTSTIHSANDVSFVRSWVKVLRNDEAQFAYKVLNIAGLDFLVAVDTMSGIDTPPIRETLVPDVLSGFLGSALGAIFMAALKRLGNTLAGFGMGFFTMSVAFIDNIFSALGYPALVSTIFGWMDSLFANVPTLLGYGLTLVDQIFSLITISAGNTLTQLTSIITIWIGMYSTVMDMLNGILTPGINLWNDLGVGNFIRIGAVLYPLWLLMMASDKGGQAVIDHLNGVLNIGSFFLNFILNVAGFFVSLLTGLIGAIRG